MKTKFSIISIIIILSIIFMGTVTPANALPGSNWATGIKLQNLNLSVPAQNISITLRDSAGTTKSTISTTSTGVPLTIPAGGSVEVYLPNYVNVPDSQLSAEIASDVPLGAVATMTNYDYGIADSYNTMTPSTIISIPYVYHNHNSWSTEIFIQNTTGSPVTGTITLFEPSSSVSYRDSGLHNKDVSFSIPAYGTTRLNTLDATHNDLGWFIGAARIESSGTVVAVANQVRIVGPGDYKGNVLIQSRGVIENDSGTNIVVPSLYKNFSGVNGTWTSGIKLVNPSNLNPITVVVTFSSDPDRPSYSRTKTVTIQPLGNAELYLATLIMDDNSKIPDMYKGFAKLSVNTGTVLATVQHTNYNAAGGYGVALGYAGFSTGHSKVSLPSLYRWPSGAGIWISGIKVQNMGLESVIIDINLKTDPDVSTWTGSKTGITLDPGEAYELYLGVDGNLDNGLSVPARWKGSALITATGTGELVATVLHTNYGRHVANMYTGVGIE